MSTSRETLDVSDLEVVMADGCRDCKRCTNSDVANAARTAGRRTAALMSFGASEVGFKFTKKCRICGHPLSLHMGAASDRVQPGVSMAMAPQQDPRQRPPGPVPYGWSPPVYGPPPVQQPFQGYPSVAPSPQRSGSGTAPDVAPHLVPRVGSTPPPAAPEGPAGQLRRLQELSESGLITAEEFTKKRAEIIARL